MDLDCLFIHFPLQIRAIIRILYQSKQTLTCRCNSLKDNINQKKSKNQVLSLKKIMVMSQNKKALLTNITAVIDQIKKRKKAKRTKRKVTEIEEKKEFSDWILD